MFAGRQSFAGLRTLNGVIWYICTQMLCYGVAYVLTPISKKLDSIRIYVAPVFVAMLIWYSDLQSGLWQNDTGRGLASFFVGVLPGRLLEFQQRLTKRQQTILRVALAAELLLILYSQISPLQPELTEKICHFYGFLVFTELIMLLYGVKWVNRICSAKIVRGG